ncbi:maleylpyruvate isomerase family mycothiol-dependent enzyme [Streptomyces sp. NPDC001296]
MTASTDLTRADLTALLDALRGSAARLAAGLGELTGLQAREPSALAGWSRGHVITHLTRSADAYRWLLHLARTGIEPGPRADGPALARARREGAGRDAATLVADLHKSVDRLLDEATAMPIGRWSALVTALAGRRHPASFTLHRARREREIDHADLSLGHTTADWPVDFVIWALDDTVAALTARDFPPRPARGTRPRPCLVARPDRPDGHRFGPCPPRLARRRGAGRGGDTALRSELPLPTPPA